MAELLSVSTAVPAHRVTAAETKRYLADHLSETSAQRYCRMVDASGIENRHSVVRTEDLFQLQTLEERSREYTRHAVTLGQRVASDALSAANVTPAAVTSVIPISCTGHMMPSLDAHLVNTLRLSATSRRIPITLLGCSAGVGALGLAAELLRPGEAQVALVTSVELCSLCLQVAEPSPADVVGAILFGDGAAAAVIAAEPSGRGPELLASRSVLWPDTMDELGMRLTSTGFRFVLSPSLPRVVRARLLPAVEDFLGGVGFTMDDVRFHVIHPGGPKILDAAAASLRLTDRALRPSYEVWQRFGNLSSATVFFILRQLQESAPPSPGELGLMLAFGPGVTCEMVLLRAGGWLSGQG